MRNTMKVYFRRAATPTKQPSVPVGDVNVIEIAGEEGWKITAKVIDGKLRLESDRALKIIPTAANSFIVEFDT